jgi:hypothetical protein
VQRSLATVVLFVIGFLPVAPLFTNASAEPQIPLCCRTNGKHKCAMRVQDDGPGSNAQPALRSRCDQWPFLPPFSSRALTPSVFVPKASQRFFAAIVSHPAAQAQVEGRFRLSFERSRQKRGPPSFLL